MRLRMQDPCGGDASGARFTAGGRAPQGQPPIKLLVAQLGFLPGAFGTDQDDAGDGILFDASDVPAGADGALRTRQLQVAVPAAAPTVGADGPQRLADIDRKPFRNFLIVPPYLRPPSSIVPPLTRTPLRPKTGPQRVSGRFHSLRHSGSLRQP